MASFGERLQELITKNGITREEFIERVNAADECGGATLDKGALSRYISDTQEPRYKTVVRIAKAFNISTDYLLGLSDIKATINDDMNIAAKTTGLSIDCVEALKYLKDKTCPNGNIIAETIEKYTLEAADYVDMMVFDEATYTGKDLSDVSFDWNNDHELDANVLFSLLHHLDHAPVITGEQERHIHFPGSSESIVVQRDLVFNYYYSAVINYLSEHNRCHFDERAREVYGNIARDKNSK